MSNRFVPSSPSLTSSPPSAAALSALCTVSGEQKLHCDCGACRQRRRLQAEEARSPAHVGSSAARLVTSLSLSAISLSSPAVAVLDFDGTLTCEPIGHMHGYESIVSRGFGGQPRLDALDALCAELREAGVVLAVVSFNLRDTIRRALRVARLEQYFGVVAGSDECEAVSPALSRRGAKPLLKSHAVKSLVLNPLGAEPAGLLFVDDDASNIREIEREMPDATVIHVRPKTRDGRATGSAGGMGDTEFGAIREWLARVSGGRGAPPESPEPPAYEPEVEDPDAEWRDGATQGDHLMFAKVRRQSLGGSDVA